MTRDQPTFSERCYALLRTVPRGRVTTYQELAKAMRSKGYRAVGQAMNRNPSAPVVPCHRVVRADGSLGGYQGGIKKKCEILRREGITVKEGRVVDFDKKLFRFGSERSSTRSR